MPSALEHRTFPLQPPGGVSRPSVKFGLDPLKLDMHKERRNIHIDTAQRFDFRYTVSHLSAVKIQIHYTIKQLYTVLIKL